MWYGAAQIQDQREDDKKQRRVINHTEKPTAAEDVEAWDGRVERARMGDGQGDRICEKELEPRVIRNGLAWWRQPGCRRKSDCKATSPPLNRPNSPPRPSSNSNNT